MQHYINGGSFKNRLNGGSISYSFPSSFAMRHEVKYALEWRHIFGISDDSSVTTRRQAGHGIKSSLSHSMTNSTRDCHVLPTRGYFIRLGSELAGLGGSVRFLKTDLSTQLHVPLYKLLSFNIGIRVGHIAPFWGQKLSILDKYQMGGPLSVRGFALNSLGPKDRNDSIGGDLSCEGSIGVSFPLSASTSGILRGHLFANAGILHNIEYTKTMKQNIQHCIAVRPNASIGAGLQVKLGDAAKLEMNVAYPLSMQTGAIFHKGLQVGLGVEFL